MLVEQVKDAYAKGLVPIEHLERHVEIALRIETGLFPVELLPDDLPPVYLRDNDGRPLLSRPLSGPLRHDPFWNVAV